MSDRPIIDAGPALNFLSINKERLLFSFVGPLATPECVEREVLRKARSDPRFAAAAAVWKRLGPKWMEVLSDDVTPSLTAAVQRISGLPMAERLKEANDLGEAMVVGPATVLAEAGGDAVVVIADGQGACLAALADARPDARRAGGGARGAGRRAALCVQAARPAAPPPPPGGGRRGRRQYHRGGAGGGWRRRRGRGTRPAPGGMA